MAQFSVNTTRFDPYKNFKFRVKWDGRYVAGVSKVGSLKRSTEVVEHRDGRYAGDVAAIPFDAEFEILVRIESCRVHAELRHGISSD